MILGINASDGLVVEGVSENNAQLLWPSPVLTPAKFVDASSDKLEPSHNFRDSALYFREDSFDAVSRIRRGRFYKSTGNSHEWRISNPLRVPVVGRMPTGDGSVHIYLTKYDPFFINKNSWLGSTQNLVVLGTQASSTVWMMVGVETILTGEQLVTLKARQSFGMLPDIEWSSVPGDVGLLKDKIENLRDDVYRAGAESVVDRAREAATAILSVYLQGEGVTEAKGKDLGDLLKLMNKKYGDNAQRILKCAAEIPQRLHSRGRNPEQEKRDKLRPIREQDAELAVQCIGVMLCDLEWARWL